MLKWQRKAWQKQKWKKSFVRGVLDTTSLLSDTHRHTSTHTFWKAQSRQLRGPSDFTDKHTYASSEIQWKSILCACFSFPLTPVIPLSPLPCAEHHPLSLLDLLSKPQKTLPYMHTHTHTHTDWLTTEAKAWWSHSNKAATRNTRCCDSTSFVTAEDIKHDHPEDNPTYESHKTAVQKPNSGHVYIFL